MKKTKLDKRKQMRSLYFNYWIPAIVLVLLSVAAQSNATTIASNITIFTTPGPSACLSNPCPIDANCTDIVSVNGSTYQCNCAKGFQFLPVIDSCQDVDECLLGSSNCDSNAWCSNTNGSFSCACNVGYSGDGFICEDINECLLGSDGCDANASCTNFNGSYACSCHFGFSGDGFTCNDVKECLTGLDSCDVNAQCSNTIGSYRCSCNTGYSGDGYYCTDINECYNTTNICDANADCTNTNGSYSCACKTGYSGDGVTCVRCKNVSMNCNTTQISDVCPPIPPPCGDNALCTQSAGGANYTCTCKTGFSGFPPTSPCVDTDECATVTGICSGSTCTNTNGGFTCSCPAGYQQSGYQCKAITDPCTSKVCAGNATCQREGLDGSCRCNDGFTGDGQYYCSPTCEVLIRNGITYNFTKTPPLQTGYSLQSCIFTGQPLAAAQCVVKQRNQTFSVFFDASTLRLVPCVNVTAGEIANNIVVDNLNETSFEETVSQLDILTSNSANLSSNDVTSTASLINTVSNSTNFTVSPFAYKYIVYIADHVTTFLEQPSANQTATDNATNNDLVRSLTSLAYRVNLTSGSNVLTVSSPNVEAEVKLQQNLTQDAQFKPSVYQDPNNQTTPIQPVTITIPLEALQEAERLKTAMRKRRQVGLATDTPVRAVFLLHRSSTLFPSNQEAKWVVSGNVGNETTPASIMNLNDKVNITHNTVNSTGGKMQNDSTLQAQYVNQSCVFWNFTTNDWSTQGCCLVPGSNPATCQCDHLTNFAILVNIYDVAADVPLQLTTYVGCGLSVAALAITVILMLSSKDIRSRRPMQVLINVCVNLSIVYLIFVAGIDQRQHEERCLASALLLHFFLLSNWCWMAVYGHLLYKSIVKIFDAVWDNYMLKAYLFSFGFPAIVVTINIVVNKVYEVAPDTSPVCGQALEASLSHTMLASNMCWIKGYSFYIGFLLPVATLLLFNLVMFLLVIVSLTCKRKNLSSSSKNPSHRHNLIIALSIASTLGLVWFFGFFMMVSDNVQYLVAMSWLFTIVASLQGFCVFALTCLRQGDVRRLWWPPVRRLLCCCCGEADTPSKSTSVTSTANKSNTGRTDMRSNSNPSSDHENVSVIVK